MLLERLKTFLTDLINNLKQIKPQEPQGDPNFPADQSQAEEYLTEGGLNDQQVQKMLGTKQNPTRSYDELLEEMEELRKLASQTKDKATKKKLTDKLKRLKTLQDKVDSKMITPWGEGKDTYQRSDLSPEARTASLKGTKGYVPQYHKALEFHHLNLKSIRVAIEKQMRKLRAKGKATTQNLINLHRIDESFGSISGSREEAALRMHRATHDYMHKELMLNLV